MTAPFIGLAEYLKLECDLNKLSVAKLADLITSFVQQDIDSTVETMDLLLQSYREQVFANVSRLSNCSTGVQEGWQLTDVNIFAEDGIAKVLFVWSDGTDVTIYEQFKLAHFI